MNRYTNIYDFRRNDGAMIFTKSNHNIKKYINEEAKDIQHLHTTIKSKTI